MSLLGMNSRPFEALLSFWGLIIKERSSLTTDMRTGTGKLAVTSVSCWHSSLELVLFGNMTLLVFVVSRFVSEGVLKRYRDFCCSDAEGMFPLFS